MYITNKDFEALKAAIELLPSGDDFNKLDEETQYIISKADTTLLNLLHKKKKDNKRTAEYIAKKRTINKNYAR